MTELVYYDCITFEQLNLLNRCSNLPIKQQKKNDVVREPFKTIIEKHLSREYIEGKGFKISYKQKEIYGCGRFYATGGGLQTYPNEVRKWLVNDKYVDIDFENCHPTILYNVLKMKYKDDERLTVLERYISNRDYMLKKNRN